MTLLIELGQGDSDFADVILSDANGVFNLFGYTLIFSMSKGSTSYDITCTSHPTVSISQGGVRIPFTATETAVVGTFSGKIYATVNGQQITWPSGSEYFSVNIYPAV